MGAGGYAIYAASTGQQINGTTMLLAAGGGALAGTLIGAGVGIASGMSVAAATTAAVTTAGTVETANIACGGDMCASEAQDATQAAQAVLPAAGNAASQAAATINTGSNAVYQFIENGTAKYYGITNDFERRAAEHLASRNWVIQEIPGLNQLSRYDARAVEQVLIQQAGLPNLYNKINSIATSNPIYQAAVQRGTEILKAIQR